MIIAGLTGNYGMGKSTVLKMFRELGAITVDADGIVDKLLQDQSVLGSIRKAFGNDVFSKDGSLDRAHIASIVFRDKKMRTILEDIIHPPVFEKIEQLIQGLEKGDSQDKVVVIEIPLMFEKGRTERFHRTITVHAHEDIVLHRLKGKGISRDDAEIRLKAQMDIGEKIRRSDFAIDNGRNLDDTKAQVKDIFKKLLAELKG